MSTWFPVSSARTAKVAVLLAFALSAGATAHAQHRARLSKDLADHLTGGAQNVEVIVGANADQLAAKYNLRIKRHLKSGGVLLVNAGQLAALQQDGGVDHLSGNARYHTSSIDPVDEGIGADQVWAGAGPLPKLTGHGVTVALIDSGLDVNHKAIKGHVVATVDFTGGNGSDPFGHGTHVAAIIEGNAGATADTAMYRGVGYGASLVNLRVLGADGSGSAADVIEAIDWAIDHAKTYNIRIINLSLGSDVLQPYRDDPVCAAVERAVRAGLLVVAAAGNHGQTADGRKIAGGITSPGNSPWALTVGALDAKGTADRGDDEVASFSSTGPTAFDHELKPDLVAPGRRIVSAESIGSLLSANFPLQHVAGSGNNSYIYGSGTSMATAVVTGAAALLLQERPGLGPLSVKAVLQKSAEFLPKAGLVGAGAGSLNVLAAANYAQTHDVETTTIAGDAVSPSGLFTTNKDQIFSSQSLGGRPLRKLLRRTKRRGGLSHGVFSTSGDSLVWGAGDGDSLVWGAGEGDSLVWGAGEGDSLVWGAGDSLVWGAGDSLVWGAGDSLVWGAGDSLVWGAGDSLVWGAGDSLVWGAGDSLVWGAGDSLVWGA